MTDQAAPDGSIGSGGTAASAEFWGIGASRGAALGPASIVGSAQIVLGDIADPRAALLEASDAAAAKLARLSEAAAEAGRDEAAAVLSAQALMARDPMLLGEVRSGIDGGLGLQQALSDAATAVAQMLAALPDEYLAARAADVGEVAELILRCLAELALPAAEAPGVNYDAPAATELATGRTQPTIIVAVALSAADAAQLSPDTVSGLALAQGGPTGHVAVIARSLGIPAVVGAVGVAEAVNVGDLVALDGDTGEVVVRPDAAVAERFGATIEASRTRMATEAAYTGRAVTFGETELAVAANVAGPDDVVRAAAAGADGIGLYRTEFLFSDRDEPPTEDEQYEHYSEALRAFSRPVVIRLADIGGDKPVPWLGLDPEENPFLGERGPRLYALRPELLATQLRALLRAAEHGDLRVMVPMVATTEDLLGVSVVLEEQREQLRAQGHMCAELQLGVMIEVPSAALTAEHLAAHADFFSIGTNDLAQYTLAADRTNARLAGYNDVAHPAVLRLCAHAAAAAVDGGISISVCGDAAADPELAPAFAAMGMDRLSVAPPLVNSVKALIDRTDADAARAALRSATAAADAASARAALSGGEPPFGESLR